MIADGFQQSGRFRTVMKIANVQRDGPSYGTAGPRSEVPQYGQ
jgi:hypothetical protein